jgi:AcrR family transcriptional regulator
MSNEEIRDLLIHTAIKLIRKKPSNSITVRELAKEADVNPAAISYYFGGKEQLFEKAKDAYWQQICEIFREIEAQTAMTPDEAKGYCNRMLQFYLSSRGILRTEQTDLLKEGMDSTTGSRVASQFDAIRHMILLLNPHTPQRLITARTIRVFSSLAHPALWLEAYEKIGGAIPVDDMLNIYAEEIVNSILLEE